ncbi:MAG: hypothetical protein AAFY60_17080, partial [Myxococcota bacterium]
FSPLPEGADAAPQLEVGMQYRPRLESSPVGPIRFDPANQNSALTHRARLTSTLSFQGVRGQFAFQNVYVSAAPEADAPVEALEAYVEFGEGPLRLRLGRQQITFGTGRILTGPLWSQRGRPIDALRAVYRGEDTHGELIIARHNGSGIYRDFLAGRLRQSFGALALAVNGLLETNEFLRETDRVGFEAGYRRFTGGLEFYHESKLKVRGELLAQLGSFDGDASLIGGPADPEGDGDIRAWFAGLEVAYAFNEWLTPAFFVDALSGDGDNSDSTVGVFDTVFGYRRRWYGRIDRFIRMPRDTLNGGLVNAGVRTRSPLGGGQFFTEWHYFHIPRTDLVGDQGAAGVELDLRWVYPIREFLKLELAYFTFSRLGDFRDLPGTNVGREVNLKHYGYAQLDLEF